MTCEEFWRLEPIDPDELTRAELAAWYQHGQDCRPCGDRFDREAKEAFGRLTPAELAECCRDGIRDAFRVMADPEAGA